VLHDDLSDGCSPPLITNHRSSIVAPLVGFPTPPILAHRRSFDRCDAKSSPP